MKTFAAPSDLRPNLSVDHDRLWSSLMELGQIGGTEKGGVCRIALTDLDRQGRDLFVRWAKEAGCTIKVDQLGNVFARREGRDPAKAPVMTGSHLDTQPTGGKFDGAYGVMAGLEVLRVLHDSNYVTEAPIEVAVWTNEEGCRFAPAMVASGVFGGAFTLDHALSIKDRDGVTFAEALKKIGYDGKEPVGGRKVGAFFEAHIEQGPILEREKKTIGVVTGAQGQRWYEINWTGMESHAGTTPMEGRRDALVGAGFAVFLASMAAYALSRLNFGGIAVDDAKDTIGDFSKATGRLRQFRGGTETVLRAIGQHGVNGGDVVHHVAVTY